VITLPEKLRKAMERTVKELSVKDNVYGIGLFGSWSRGEAEPSSDVDLLILDKTSLAYEYVERIQAGGFLVDLDHVPRQWIHGPIPPEIDQKLYEMQILYDRDWSLTNTKLLMGKSYASPERVEIRTEAHVVESDIYLSRATSALSRQDFRSSYLFAVVALENILRVPIEIALGSFSNSRFIETLESSLAKLGMHNLFNGYVEIARLGKVDDAGVRHKLGLFKTIWDEISVVAKQHTPTLESSHFTIRTKLNYYLNPAFLQGAVRRTISLMDSGKTAEASHYLNNILIDIAENYVWLRSSIENVKIDYTTLIRSFESLEENNPRSYENLLKFLNLVGIDKTAVSDTVEKIRAIIIKIRRDRKDLIKNHLLKS
jgi:predicted nucleotidyltransferase